MRYRLETKSVEFYRGGRQHHDDEVLLRQTAQEHLAADASEESEGYPDGASKPLILLLDRWLDHFRAEGFRSLVDLET